MDGVTDAVFRRVVARQAPADVSFTEFTSVGDICRGPDFLLTSLLYSECERPVVAQLYGKDPDLFYQAAHIVCESDSTVSISIWGVPRKMWRPPGQERV